ncbi:homeobox-DDT domain protein RLT2 isoform X4 [Amaranthus tricolor]|uniref:homeobox-DDT domain protein RLT2 isoform X4 n=1 Tax=Amaranthus tricolor TaxID=29722 RepID=UPI00258C2EE1|nr:homeobox-DDT domain protein RLT2 isoform X4 [Amaranthus tricolor]
MMEGGNSDGEKKPPESGGDGGGGGGGTGGSGEPKTKRKMKTPSQLEALEKTYQIASYPSEALRAELSAQLGLSDRQLQMWFCHRRLKDRKPQSSSGGGGGGSSGKRSRKGELLPSVTATVTVAASGTPPLPPPPVVPKDDMLGSELGIEHGSGSGSGSSPYGHMDPRRAYVGRPGVAVPRISGHGRYYEAPQSVSELRAIAFVEAQLGEPLREDGPALGMEFDPLPPGAFGAPIASLAPQKTAGRTYEVSVYELSDAKSTKGPSRALHEYQFLPEQPTVRSESYERVSQSLYYGSPSDGPGTKTPPLSSGRSNMHGYDEVPVAYGVQNQLPSLNLMSHQGNVSNHMSSTSGDYEAMTRKSPYVNVGMESSLSTHPISGMASALVPSERRATQEEDAGRLERKRKSEEARIAKEIEAHEKKMRKELERQDILRRKREEQMRKEMERQDRERRKEEERLLREKQREEERYQREQRREMERREKFLLKESIRAEKMKQKEEVRREREAARQKAANDRAVAKRLAKESTELIEDERLELMEIAASRKSLTSILSLDSETLQNLDSFRDMLRRFPPTSVQLKKPFATRPWLGSEENVGNLLMVWRFLITFTDVLGLWPFTLDEFMQAFHDYDPRLLGEIHVALLRTVIKDIEDVARTPSIGLGVNLNSVANPVGGHPQIVEGAYAWGFDIRSWQCNLSPLTWPEVLRQFALAAGFGPKLKKRNVEQGFSREENEGNDGIDVVSNLRNGAAVEKAVAIMRERGYSNPRRSRHRLTPGTVKFAAFHVLSLEGSDGLNILEVADRIQKSGLRDLTTSKTPEASIAAALSRDTKLFERTAPSTYCVRSPYRKDPVDAEAILSSAREKIRVFKIGFADEVEADVDGMGADDVEAYEVEKDDESESDTAEDPEIDDLTAELTPNKEANLSYDMNSCVPRIGSDNGSDLHSRVDKTSNGLVNAGDVLSSAHLESFKEMDNNGCFVEESIDVGGICQEANNTDHEDTDVDESCPGEPWVQGLMEGEYSNLSVEERLNALVALIDVATEGNTVRVALEERLEAATALKKQMWAEAQLDKRRLKEEFLMKTPYATFVPNKSESNMMASAADTGHSPMLSFDKSNNETMMQQKSFFDAHIDNNLNAASSEKNSTTLNFVLGSDNVASQQSVYAAERCRAQLKSYIGHKAEEMYVYRSLPLGQDRRRNRYWQFIASASCNDPGAGRLFVELHNGGWRLIDSEEGFDALLASLDVRGVRECHLHALLRKVELLYKESVRRKGFDTTIDKQNGFSVKAEASEVPFNRESSGGVDSPSSTICASNSEMSEPSSSFKIESGRNSVETKNSLRRYKSFEDWMWKECFFSSALCSAKFGKKRCTELISRCDSCRDLYFFEDNHCSSCHKTYTAYDKSFNFSEHVVQCEGIKGSLQSLEYPPPRIRLLKALLAQVEVSVPSEALQPFWSDDYRKSWGMKLYMSSSAEDLLQVLTLLEGAIKRDFLSSHFETTGELLASGNVDGYIVNDVSTFGSITMLPWIPQTTSAVALRLMELDSAISYLPDQKEKDSEPRHFLKLHSKYTVVRNVPEDELAAVDQQEDAWNDRGSDLGLVSIRGSNGRGGRGRTRGGKSQRRVVGSRVGEPSSRSVASNERLGDGLGGWKGRSSRGKGGRKRGRRSVRKRQKSVKKVAPAATASVGVRSLPEPIIFDKSPPGFSGRDEWNGEDSRQMMADEVDVNDDSNSERSDYVDDEHGQASGDEYDDMAIDDYAAVYNGRPTTHSHYNDGDEEDDDNDNDEVGDDDDGDEVADDVDEDDMDVDGGEYEQGDLDVGGYLNADSDDEIVGNGDDDQDDTSESASTEYSSDE